MTKKNQIKFLDFHKGVIKCIEKNFPKHNIFQKSGTGIRYEVFKKKDDEVPFDFWLVHEDKYIHKGDLKKVCKKLGITVNDFIDLL